ncbi:hypothetical protein BC936DRAFT_145283 [Jimgerdemannia flammicorona]|uniref:Uncharacterized protein n=2 Tax=Jimgerdemannia flammicorona TaxID=994334 RepID=A0A433DAC8_9FUNG|nr:hypothetical protein BC936DRAFT_145283 [Jimgerdemannia flammicorona]RUS21888.1 hypothetical protein BC938DRAFT_475333 [Jimgerdemannia flammicorona]
MPNANGKHPFAILPPLTQLRRVMATKGLQKLVFVTGNKNKLAEVQTILEGAVDLVPHKLDLPELQGTTQEVAIAKCKHAAEIVWFPALFWDGVGFD